MFVARQENSDDNLLDKVVCSEDDAYALYNNHALQMGFSIRKGKPRYYSGSKNIRQPEFLCSKEGFKVDKDPCEEKKLNRLETRTGCKAFIHSMVEDGIWRVIAFNPEHNHELALQSERHLLRSTCHISKSKASVIDSMVNAGISTKNAYSYLREEVRGSENVGFTKRDCYNYVNKQKMMMISGGDAQSLLNHFKQKTYRRSHVLFHSSKSMGNWSLVTIFTDQDQAMSKAIEAVFPNTHHRLCLWHISKNAHSHLGELNTNTEFKYLFNKCQKYCDSTLEFQQTWDEMIQKFGLESHRWLNMMYKSRHKWSTAFIEDSFTAEFKASSRSESSNNVLNNIVCKTTSLTNFVIEYDNLVAGILGHAAQVYTCKIFKLFENEFLNSLAMVWKQVDCQDTIDVFELKEENSERVRIVHFDHLTNNISCSCKKFESLGVLYCHALRVFSIKNLTTIPSQYILKYWTKDAKSEIMAYEQGVNSIVNGKEAKIIWPNSMIRIANTIIYKSQGNDSLYCHALRVFSIKYLTTIPSQYILKCWTKDAKRGIMAYEQGANSIVNGKEAEIIWPNSMIRIANTTTYKSQGNDSLKNICQKILVELDEKIEREFARWKLGTDVHVEEDRAI